MQKRRTYHSSIKLAYALDLHQEWLPKEFTRTIPRSTSHAWKHDVKEKYVGHQFADAINSNIDELKTLYNRQVEKERQLFIAYTRIKVTILQILGREYVQHAFKENFRKVVDVIEQTKDSFTGGVRKVCSHLNIKPHVFYYWRGVAKFSCSLSPKSICVKKVPSQATYQEINVMRSLLSRKRFENWPICSVWAYAIRKGHTALSLGSWYKYNQQYSIRQRKKKGQYKKEYDPLRASAPNEIWHADVTHYQTLDGIRHFIYLIVDNYSRHFLNVELATVCNGAIRTKTLREAIAQEFGETSTMAHSIDLIVDGGTENNNQTVEQFIRESQVDIEKKIALKDIKQSNAMVESSNKTLKYHYLFPKQPIANGEQLRKHLEYAVYDFCTVRPHHALDGCTPFEVQYGRQPKIERRKPAEVQRERCQFHKAQVCNQNCCSKG